MATFPRTRRPRGWPRHLTAPACASEKPPTGRVNIHAVHAGLFRVNVQLIDAFNLVDPAITIATLADFAPVEEGTLVATVKIIPFGLPAALVLEAEKVAASDEAFFRRALQGPWHWPHPDDAARHQTKRARQDDQADRAAAGAVGQPYRDRTAGDSRCEGPSPMPLKTFAKSQI